MPGTRLGGLQAAKTNKIKYGDDFYKRIGADGGRKSKRTGFAISPEMAQIAGAIGGLKASSKRYNIPLDTEKLTKLEKEMRILKSQRRYQNAIK